MNAELPFRRKLLAERYIDDVLAAIAEDEREPDEWEAVHLCAAIGAINSRMYRAAAGYTDKAVEPPERRAGDWTRTEGTLNIGAIRAGLEQVKVLAAPAA
jgi:hypothetical protein